MLSWLKKNENKRQALSRQVENAVREQLWQRTEARIGEMSLAEARGYARARASLLVAQAADEAMRDSRLRPALRRQVVAAAMEAVVDWVVQRRRPAAAPARRAA